MKAIVFVLRGCPAGWLGAYGNEWVATPNLDRLAAEAVVFDRHISDRPRADAGSAAWLGGMPELSVLATLRAANLLTILVRANHPDTDGPEWFYARWSEVFDSRPLAEDQSPLDSLIRNLPGVLDRLAATKDFLLWIEIDRLLPPWDVRQEVFDAYLDDQDDNNQPEPPPDVELEKTDEDIAETPQPAPSGDPVAPPTQDQSVTPWFDPPTGLFDTTDPDAWEWLHSTFAAVVTSLDAELGVVFDQLRACGLDQSAAWLLTSDYGYPLGEHGQIGLHRPWLHEELVHLPLIIRLPGADQACRRVLGITQPPDVATALLDLFGLKPTEATSLLQLARGETESHRPVAVSELELNRAAEIAIRTEAWAYLLPVRVPEGETRPAMLFEKPDDRWEVNDLRSRNIECADELEHQLKSRGG